MAKKKKRVRFKKWFVYTVLGLIVFLCLFILLKTVPVFVVMEGDKTMTLEVHSEFVDPGAYNRFTKKPITPKGTVDVDTLGKYRLKYSSFLQSFSRTVKIVDTTAPVLTLTGRDYILIPINSEYADAGVTAIDNYDGDITKDVKVKNNVDTTKAGEYQITYTSKDSSRNEATITRTVKVSDDDFDYAGTITNDAGVSDQMINEIKNVMNAYYRSIKYLDPQDTTSLFHSEYRRYAYLFNKGIELMVNARKDSINNLVLDDCHYDLLISSIEDAPYGEKEVTVWEDGFYNFHHLPGVESRQHNVENRFFFQYDNGEYKITSVNHIEGAFIYLDDQFTSTSDYKTLIDDLGNKYTEAYNSSVRQLEQNRQDVNSGKADKSGIRTAAHPYDRNKAVEYAKQYGTVRNLQYPYYGSNCMNFVSQCMHAGGIPYDTTGSYQWKNFQGYYDPSDGENGFTYAFIHIYYFQNYIEGIDDGMVVDQNLNLYLGEPGDIVYVDSSTSEYGDMAHVILITDVIKDGEGNIVDYLVCGNTNDQYCFPLSAMGSVYKQLAKVEGYN